jgi:hypothetical protein
MSGYTMLDGVKAFWDGLDLERIAQNFERQGDS